MWLFIALFLELARTALFLSLCLRMISLIVVLALEKLKRSSVARLSTHKLNVSVDASVGLVLVATTLAGKHMANALPNLVLVRR